jgi:hypothetical protein
MIVYPIYERLLMQREFDEKCKRLRALYVKDTKKFCTSGDFGFYGHTSYFLNAQERTCISYDPYMQKHTLYMTEREYDTFTLGDIIKKIGTVKEHIYKITKLPE